MYKFDEVIDRGNTNSSKWEDEALEGLFGEKELLPLWVADMDFKAAPEIISAIVKRAEHGIYGYSIRQKSYYKSIINWTERRFNWKIEKDWIEYTPGIVPAINISIQAYCRPGDKVLIQEPVYYPFKDAILNNGCIPVNNELILKDDKYYMDFELLKEQVKDAKTKMIILCSPHNPVSRVWTREELIQLADLCIENNVLILSDEIHNDLVFGENKHIMLASISDKYAKNSITYTSPSKTFNLAGLQASNIIIPNKILREKFARTVERNSMGGQNPLSIVALEAAYNHGEDWLEDLLKYLEGNIRIIKDHLSEYLPKAKLIEPEATYLGWIDFREYETNGKILEECIVRDGKVALDGGSWFGKGGEGFMRINFACPSVTLKKGLKGITKAVNKNFN